MMETEVLGYKAPLYGRRTGQIKLEPFHFTYLSRFFPDLNVEALLYIYSITGGVPAYFLQIDPAVSFYDNIKKHLLDQSAYLAREPEFILREEFKEPRTYFSILRAIALGRHRHGEIINETGLEKNVLMKYLSVLQSLGIVSRNVPITEKIPEKCKMGLYVISDLLMKFWFANIYLNRDYIEEGHGEELIEEKIKPSMERYVSHAFEHICRDYFKRWLRISGKYAGFDRVGRWWDRNEEIDVVALNWQKNSSIFGEVKWSKNPVGTDILNNLRQKSLHVRWG
jgi:AAA+ ATPase superfamily predicted ATPase